MFDLALPRLTQMPVCQTDTGVMTKSGSNEKSPADRKERLAEALRVNLKRRKLQVRGRKAEERETSKAPSSKDK